jgi:hypothetical protein
MGSKQGDPPRGDVPLHIVEKGNFSHARCDCGWRGPARRSRKRAREDAAAHLLERCSAFSKR